MSLGNLRASSSERVILHGNLTERASSPEWCPLMTNPTAGAEAGDGDDGLHRTNGAAADDDGGSPELENASGRLPDVTAREESDSELQKTGAAARASSWLASGGWTATEDTAANTTDYHWHSPSSRETSWTRCPSSSSGGAGRTAG